MFRSLIIALTALALLPILCAAQSTPETSAARWKSIDGTYTGTLTLTRLKNGGAQFCNSDPAFNAQVYVSTSGRKASVTMEGHQMTGTRKTRSWRAILDSQQFTRRISGRRATRRGARITYKETYWVTGDTYCQGIYKGYLRR